MIRVENLSKNFGKVKAVDSISFSVQKGDILGFLGPNGAGKTTTVKSIAGFLKPDKGKIFIDEKKFNSDDIELKKKIGYMPEETPLYQDMTTIEYLNFIAEVHKLKDIQTEVKKVIKLAGLEIAQNKLIESLSKGYKSRVSFAAAIIHNPPILLLDEPTDGLDPNQRNELRKLIKELSKDKAIIISTHLLEEVKVICNRVFVISNGKKLLDGSLKDMQKYDETKRLIITIKEEDKEKLENLIGVSLTFLSVAPKEAFKRYIFEVESSASEIVEKIKNEVDFEEIFYDEVSLDKAFHKMTIG